MLNSCARFEGPFAGKPGSYRDLQRTVNSGLLPDHVHQHILRSETAKGLKRLNAQALRISTAHYRCQNTTVLLPCTNTRSSR